VSEGDSLTQLNLTRSCCRAMLLTHVDLISKAIKHIEIAEGENLQGIEV
jgi:DNA-directed RNA polymerase subunit N (RpoN/RPB10)